MTVKHAKGIKTKKLSDIEKTEYMERLMRNRQETYLFKFKDWPENLKRQWAIIEDHFTDDMAPELPRHDDSLWGEETVKMRLAKLEAFFGFLLVTPIFLAVLMLTIGARKWKEVVLTSTLVTFSIYLFFQKVFQIILPAGEFF